MSTYATEIGDVQHYVARQLLELVRDPVDAPPMRSPQAVHTELREALQFKVSRRDWHAARRRDGML